MKRFKKVSYDDDFSDSNSTIIDFEMGINSNVNEAINVESTEVDATTSSALPGSSNNYLLYKFLDKDDELESILKKYDKSIINSTPPIQLHVTPTTNDTIELSSDDEVPAVQVVTESRNLMSKKYVLSESTLDYDLKKKDVELQVNYQTNATQSSSKTRMQECGITKKEKAAEKAKKQEEAARQKQIKQALLSATRNMKPENCMKYLTVTLDSNILNEKYSGEILNGLQGLEVKYKFHSQLIPNTVTWTRTTFQHTLDGNELVNRSEDSEVDEALLIMNWKELINLVNEKTLLPHIESTKSILNKSKLFILIYELENYFKYRKRRKQNFQKANNKNDKQYEDVPKIEQWQVETSLTELQILQSCCHKLIDTPQDMGGMVAHFTKSVALIPYKLEIYQKQQQTDWFVSGDNRDCVQVDKNGNGLKRLWQQQLTTFPLARLEHAEAIVAKYPTFKSLLEDCNKSQQREKLLQDLPIRRAAGPLTTVRKIGPELSKKVYTYFTSEKGELPI